MHTMRVDEGLDQVVFTVPARWDAPDDPRRAAAMALAVVTLLGCIFLLLKLDYDPSWTRFLLTGLVGLLFAIPIRWGLRRRIAASRPTMTLTTGAVQLGTQAPIALSAVTEWAVTPSEIRINDQQMPVRLTGSDQVALQDRLQDAIHRNQPDGPTGAEAIPDALRASLQRER